MPDSSFEKEINERVPHSYEAEKAVISCILQNNDLIEEVNATITYEMFYDPIYRAMYRSILELKNQGYIIDKVTLKDQTEPKANPMSVTQKIYSIKAKVVEQGFDASRLDDSFFADILTSAPIASSVMSYCYLIKEKYLLRKSIELSEQIILDCRRGEKTATEICNEAQNGFYTFSRDTGKVTTNRVDAYIPEILDDINRAAKCPGGITGVRTHFSKLDNMTAGFQNTDMIVIAGRPGQGKTTFALNLAYNISKLNSQKVLFFSLEMGGKQLCARVLSSISMVSSSDIRTGRIDSKKMQEIINGVSILHGTELYIDADPYLTIAELRNKCMKQKAREGLDIVFIDYLQLMHAGTNYKNSGNSKGGFMSRQEEVAEISRNIKALAKDINVPVIALSQLSREADAKKQPQLSDLRESGAIEQDADIVMLINKPDPDDEQKTDIIVAKHRNGSTGTIQLRFDKSTTRFSEYSNEA